MEYFYVGYFEIILLICIYLVLIVLSTFFSKKILLTPEFVFLCGFIPQFMLSLFYVERWDLTLSVDTFTVYIFGAISFFFFSVFIRSLLGSGKVYYETNKTKAILIGKWKLMVAVFVQLIAILVMGESLITVTGCGTLQDAINSYTINSKGNGMELPQLPGKLNLLSYSSGFVWIYYIVHGIVYKYKTSYFLLFVNLMLSTVSHFMTGSRGGVVQMIMVGVILSYLFWGEKNHWKNKLRFRYVFYMTMICVLIVVSFKPLLDLLGRVTSITNFTDYLAHYVSAEIKNLDIIIVDGKMAFRDIFEWETLNRFLSGTFGRLGFDVTRQYSDDSTYMYYNGIDMGNVYTIYSSFIKDLHYFGLIFFSALMAFISQLSLKFALRNNLNGTIELGKLIYAYILVKLFFSFFSNWFFDGIVSNGFLWTILFWWLIRIFVELSRRKKVNI